MTTSAVSKPTRRRGFTLVEMLVVVALCLVLLALLLPAVKSARQKAATAVCASNMRQLYQASILFSQDHDGRLPRPSITPEVVGGESLTPEERDLLCWLHVENGPGGGLISFKEGALWKYLGGDVYSRQAIVLCPGDQDERTMRSGARAERNFSYAYNSNIRIGELTHTPPEVPTSLRLAAVVRPGEKIMIYEELGPNDAWCIAPHDRPDDLPASRHGTPYARNPKRSLNRLEVPAYFEQGLGNHCFFDGHVELLTPRWIIEGQGVNTGHRAYAPLTTN